MDVHCFVFVLCFKGVLMHSFLISSRTSKCDRTPTIRENKQTYKSFLLKKNLWEIQYKGTASSRPRGWRLHISRRLAILLATSPVSSGCSHPLARMTDLASCYMHLRGDDVQTQGASIIIDVSCKSVKKKLEQFLNF